MFPASDVASAAPDAALDPASIDGGDLDLKRLLHAVTGVDSNASDAVLIDRIAALERLKSAAAAAQARLTATFAESYTADAAARHHRMDAARRSIAGQIALARRDSPHAGRRHVGVAAALVHDMPSTLAALSRGELSERRARIVVEQLACLTPAHRREADRLLAPELAGLGDRTAETRATAVAYGLDPEAAMAKVRGAVKDRHVGLRPAPDAMARLSALLPVTLGVAVYAALGRAAATAAAAPGGDPRTRGQLMADALVTAVTGQAITGCNDYGVPQYAAAAETGPTAPDTTHRTTDTDTDTDTAATGDTDPATDTAATGDTDPATDADTDTAATGDTDPATTTTAAASAATRATGTGTGVGTAVAVRGCTGGCGTGINLIMTDRTLFDGDDEPAYLSSYGSIPAALARALVVGSPDAGTRTWIRRLYTDPAGDHLTAMDSRRRLFPPAAQRFLLARDQTCRTPWCDAPIREYDHLQPHTDGGPTTITNAQGVCKACNLARQAPGWTARTTGHTINVTVPTGHSYPSNAPPPPRSRAWQDYSSIEHQLSKMLSGSAVA